MQETLERPRDGGNEDEYIGIEAIVHASYLPEMVKVKRGATPQEVLDVVIEAARGLGVIIENINLWNVLINDREIVIEEGKVKHNDAFVLNENATLVMSQRVVGGPGFASKSKDLRESERLLSFEDEFLKGPKFKNS